jgi:hypothetical protein
VQEEAAAAAVGRPGRAEGEPAGAYWRVHSERPLEERAADRSDAVCGAAC